MQVIDPHWRYLYVNRTAAAQGHRQVHELIGRTMMACYPGIDTTELFPVLQRVMTARRAESLRNEFVYPSGERRWFDLVIDPVPAGICVLSLDVTGRRQAEIELHHAHRMDTIGQLAGGIAHDFNNQLTAIHGFTSLLLERLGDGDLRSDLEQIKAAAERSAALTRQLLAMSRRQVMRIEPTDLNAVVANTDLLLRRVLGADVTCELRLHEAPPVVLADPQQIENVLMNLAVNARHAMPDGGRLLVGTHLAELTDEDARQHPTMTSGRYAVLTVSDTGCGMDEATRARIFEPFFTTKAPDQGTGLGLSMVYGVVKQMNGFIWVYSEPGRGTTFRLYFPTTAQAPRIRTAPAHRRRGGRRATILAVENEAGVRELIARGLTRWGHTVFAASTGQEARQHLDRMASPPDLVLADIVLADEYGPDLVRSLDLGSTRVLLLSGSSQQHQQDRWRLSDFQMLEKPFTVQELLEAVTDALGAA